MVKCRCNSIKNCQTFLARSYLRYHDGSHQTHCSAFISFSFLLYTLSKVSSWLERAKWKGRGVRRRTLSHFQTAHKVTNFVLGAPIVFSRSTNSSRKRLEVSWEKNRRLIEQRCSPILATCYSFDVIDHSGVGIDRLVNATRENSIERVILATHVRQCRIDAISCHWRAN